MILDKPRAVPEQRGLSDKARAMHDRGRECANAPAVVRVAHVVIGCFGARANLRAYESATEAKHFIGRYIAFCNQQRPHSSLDARTPDAVYFNQPTDKAQNSRSHHITRADFGSKKPTLPLRPRLPLPLLPANAVVK
ncbi:MAG: hypothetical protein ACYCX6_01670 [Vulcanimicrobiaceae bacterium]